MNSLPQVDLSNEMGFVVQDYLVVIVIIAIAVAFLLRGFWRRRTGASAACSSCPGCGSGQACSVPAFDFSALDSSEAPAQRSDPSTGPKT